MVKYLKGDIFTVSPFPSVLLHSCNCRGVWGGGVAAGFARNFPSSLRAHEKFCQKYQQNPSSLLGLSQVITSNQKDDVGNYPARDLALPNQFRFIVCIFTSVQGGGGADSPAEILINTDKSLRNLATKLFCHEKDIAKYTTDQVEAEAIQRLRETFKLPKEGSGLDISNQSPKKLDIYLPMINSGIFRTPWGQTEEILKKHEERFNFNVVTL